MSSLPSGRIVLAHYTTPSGEIQLQRRSLADGSLVFEIIANGVFLMASYNQSSERALAHHALAALPTDLCPNPRVLVGGLGMGFTVQEFLGHQVASVDVVEISSHIVEWNRTHFSHLNQNALADPRVRLIQDDVYSVLVASPPATYDAIVLDVDNGPSWLAEQKNSRLYTPRALQRWSDLLIPRGSFAVWSAQPEPAFLENMQSCFSRAEEFPIFAPSPGHHAQPIEHYLYRGVR
jgi:spermidine synthase